tara:strand:- start:1422 stop:2534 length:1113 start_codon:yes stop_codon:yes gene_type:complete
MKIFTSNPKDEFTNYQLEIETKVLEILRSGKYILGNELDKFENSFKEYIGSKYSVGVANGTDALEISLRALNIGPGDEVITVSHTAVATVSAILATGAKPVLIDIEEDFYTLDSSNLLANYSKNTKAIIAVHLYGQPCDLEKIKKFCMEKNLKLIEDVSQAHGSTFLNQKLGAIGDIACFSCYPTKNLGALGDAGIITTNNAEYAERCRMLRQYGWKNKIYSECFGRNSRLDEIQAAILNIKLNYLDKNNERRKEIAYLYTEGLSKLPIITPKVRDKSSHVFHLYVIQIENRNALIKFLNNYDIYPGIHYEYPVHTQKTFTKEATFNDLKNTEKISKKILSLPIYPNLDLDKIKRIINLINQFFTDQYHT